MHHKLAGGAFEDALQHVPGDLAFGLLGGEACFIDVRPLGFVSLDRAFCRHYLQKLQNAGVAHGALFLQRVVNFAYGRRAAGPQNPENFEFRSRGFLRRLLHGKDRTTKAFVVSTKIFVVSRFFRSVRWDNRTPQEYASAAAQAVHQLRIAIPAAIASIRLKRTGKIVEFEISDQGRGIPLDQLQKNTARVGVGGRGMEERVRQFQGALHITSNNPGIKVSVTIPVTPEGR